MVVFGITCMCCCAEVDADLSFRLSVSRTRAEASPGPVRPVDSRQTGASWIVSDSCFAEMKFVTAVVVK